jgi:hypothetical protein
MKKVKKMMFGGISKAASNAAKNAAAKAPTPPPMQKAAMDKMLAGPGTGLAPKPNLNQSGPNAVPGSIGGLKNAINQLTGRNRFAATTPAPASSGRGSIFGGGGSRNQPPPTPAPAPTKAPFSGISAGEGRAMANRMGRMGMKEGGSVSSASKRADGCATKGKTKGKMV